MDFLTEYYGLRRMRIFLNGRKVGKSCIAYYSEKSAYFTKEGLNRKTVLHELYHHLVETSSIDISLANEEREANNYSKEFLRLM